MKTTVRVPATTANLGPGFDCLGLALGLHNVITAEALDEPRAEVTVEGYGVGELTIGWENLVLVAMRHLFTRVKNAPAGVRLHLSNGVPLGSGLGSSATALVGGLVAANELCGRPFATPALADMACELEPHPDNVCAALLGGLVVGIVEHGQAKLVRLDPPESLSGVVGIPGDRILTSHSRSLLPSGYSRDDTVYNVGRSSLFVAAFATGDRACLAAAMHDRMHQPYRLRTIRGADEAIAAAVEAGAIGCTLSGSGPALFALCDGDAAAVAQAMHAAWHALGVEAETKVVTLERAGAVVLAEDGT